MTPSLQVAKTEVELDLIGRQVKAHLNAAEKHVGKAQEHAKAAALHLIDAKAALPPAEWLAWLETHSIARSTAYRLIQEHNDPSKREQRLEYDRQRAPQRVSESGTFAAPSTNVVSLDRERLLELAERVPARKIKAAIAALEAL